MKQIAVFGSTGSIGTQTLEVIKANPQLFKVSVLTAFSNDSLLIKQAIEFNPFIVVIVDETKYENVKKALEHLPITVYTTVDALKQVAAMDVYDVFLAAIVGYAGLLSTLAAVEQGKIIALANKETLVVAGNIVTQKALETGAKLLPVDSEHSAIFQCLIGENSQTVEKVILTASGGPFLGKKPNFLLNVRKDHALQHPNWTMGAKISIDSASLMNKGLEMIEAKWLFNLANNQIEVVIHPQSIIHSMVQFTDGSIKAQMGLPDMKLPIQYALAYPYRIQNNFPRLDFKYYEKLTFEAPDLRTFKNLSIAMDALHNGGNTPCIMNAANEIVVDAFLKNKMTFLGMSEVIEKCIAQMTFNPNPNLQNYIDDDKASRELASELLNEFLL